MLKINLFNEPSVLLPEKALFRIKKKQLVISDIHLGKVTHFRKNGISLHPNAKDRDIIRLTHLINVLEPKEIIFLGDLFHSAFNSEWDDFEKLIKTYPKINYKLILGNHDVLPITLFEKLNIFTTTEYLDESVLFTHEPSIDKVYNNICGHLHPGVKIRGQGKQTLTLPCMYIIKNQCILPAFGQLTGLHILPVNKSANIYVFGHKNIEPINYD